MGTDLDWRFDGDESDELTWAAPDERPNTVYRSMPGYVGMERHPDLLNLVAKGGHAVERDPAGFYLKASFFVFGFLLFLYIFV